MSSTGIFLSEAELTPHIFKQILTFLLHNDQVVSSSSCYVLYIVLYFYLCWFKLFYETAKMKKWWLGYCQQ